MANVICTDNNQTIQYAADELRSHLSRLIGGEITTDIAVGVMSAFPDITPPNVADPELDDAIDINVTNGAGYIAGINPRSVLISVYRYLTELGYRWLRPGADGEYLPEHKRLSNVSVRETPSYRHRGICIEGAVSVEHVKDIVDWMPKVGFNGYFIQFREAHTFFDRWYSHESNPYIEGEHITIEQARDFTAQVVTEIKKRGLLYHGVGHGWTCEPFGISGMGWEVCKDEVPQEAIQYLAEVNGKRELWGGVALNTNLCYGNPQVRRIITEEIADYSTANPDIDIMHFWLADGSNNHCECELCRDTSPSDLYVRMLNELDALLTERGLKTRIVFLIYVDLLWPPQTEKIANPDRFILMFAPITRTYSKSFAVGETLPELPAFERNKLQFPNNVDLNVAFLKAWQKDFPGDSFDFDYHMMWDHVRDPGYTQVAKVLSEDIKGLKKIGLDGYVSCQVQRTFFPTGLPMTVMGQTLWNADKSYDEIASDYFASAYGSHGALVRNYLEQLSHLFDPTWFRGEQPKASPEAAERLAKLPEIIQDCLKEVEPILSAGGLGRRTSWSVLAHHARYCQMLAAASLAIAQDDKVSATRHWEEAKDYLLKNELELQSVLDVTSYVATMGWFFA